MRDNAPDTAEGISHIAMISGNEMDVDVWDSLSCCLIDIDAHIKPIRIELFRNHLLHLVQQLHAMTLFRWQKIKITGGMSIWDDERMAWADGKLIKNGKGIFAL